MFFFTGPGKFLTIKGGYLHSPKCIKCPDKTVSFQKRYKCQLLLPCKARDISSKSRAMPWPKTRSNSISTTFSVPFFTLFIFLFCLFFPPFFSFFFSNSLALGISQICKYFELARVSFCRTLNQANTSFLRVKLLSNIL